MAEALELTAAIVKALDAKRAMRIEVLHTTDVTTLADYFIMCSAASTTQLRTLTSPPSWKKRKTNRHNQKFNLYTIILKAGF